MEFDVESIQDFPRSDRKTDSHTEGVTDTEIPSQHSPPKVCHDSWIKIADCGFMIH